MLYKRRPPHSDLSRFINCYWLIDSQGAHPSEQQKIIPDGYPEIVIHYGDPYRINITGEWQVQGRQLLAGQIKNHFFLENTGSSGMVGIKLQPAAASLLFDIDMVELTEKVIDLPANISHGLENLALNSPAEPEAVFEHLDLHWKALTKPFQGQEAPIELVLSHVIAQKGQVKLEDLTDIAACSQRQLERLFKRHIGLSAKFYARIIRLGHVFEMVQAGSRNWADLVYQSGFYDQSHFIKNFKEFTGEDPSAYGFDKADMANFHLMQK